VTGSVELAAAMAELAREVDRSQARCVDRITTLAGELGWRQASGIATGLRDDADGRLLGRG
jgi:predicted transcriptional regulator